MVAAFVVFGIGVALLCVSACAVGGSADRVREAWAAERVRAEVSE